MLMPVSFLDTYDPAHQNRLDGLYPRHQGTMTENTAVVIPLAHQYVSATLYIHTMIFKTYSQGRLIKQFDFPSIGKLKL